MSATLGVLAWQAAAEYVAVTLGNAFRAAERGLYDLAGLAEEHWLLLAAILLGVFFLWRMLSPRR